jgi:hypothetical protein
LQRELEREAEAVSMTTRNTTKEARVHNTRKRKENDQTAEEQRHQQRRTKGSRY